MKSVAILFLALFGVACVCVGCHPDTSGDTQQMPPFKTGAKGNSGLPSPGMSPEAQQAMKGNDGK
ncbi:MAG TPA: hypothetical protein VG944_08990 [Fimbriimonas sp.]|nr:hypothetical protein [Fimbriimonas sp.]